MNPSSSRFAPLVALWLSIGCALFALYQGQRVYQNQLQEWWLEQSIQASMLNDPATLKSRLNQLKQVSNVNVRWFTQKKEGQAQRPTYLSLLVDQETNQALDRKKSDKVSSSSVVISSKMWFDAFWSAPQQWTDEQGRLWKRFDVSSPNSSLSRVLVSVQPQAPPQVQWRFWIGIGFFFTLLFSGLASRLSASWWGGSLYLGLGGLGIGWGCILQIGSIEHQLLAFKSVLKLSALPQWPYAPMVVLIAVLPLMGLAILHSFTRGEKSPHRVAYTYMAPTLLSVSILVFVPFSLGVGLAFMRYDQGTFTWVGLSHFVEILFSQDYSLSHPLNFYFTLGVTLLWTAVNVFLHSSIGLALALLLNKKGLYLSGFYRVLLIIPWAIPNYITALIWKGMFNQQYGLINHLLSLVGLEPVGWMSHFWGAFSANVITNTWLGFPFMMVVALGALQSIPRDLYEAADLAGASPWVQFKSITLPLLKPALLPAMILGSVWTFNMFNIIYLVSGGHPNGATDILITEAYRWAFEQDRYGYASAYSLVIFFILLGYAALSQKLSKSAEEVYL